MSVIIKGHRAEIVESARDGIARRMIDEAHKHQLSSAEIAAILHGLLETQLKFIAEDEREPRAVEVIEEEMREAHLILHVVEKAITSDYVNLTAFDAARRNYVALKAELDAVKMKEAAYA